MIDKRFLGLGFTALKSNLTTLDKPYKLNFAVTYRCQSRCLTCNIWQMRPKGELELWEIQEFAKKNRYFKWIELTGGEVFLRNDIVDIARAFAENSKGLYILTIPTNSLCNHDMVLKKLKEILELGIPRVAITVSLDGSREMHDMVRGIVGNYDKAIAFFKNLMELKKEYKNLYFVFGYTLSKFNEGRFRETFESVKNDIPEITYNDFHINLGQLSDNYYSNSNVEIKAEKNIVEDEVKWLLKNRRYEFGSIAAIERVFLKNLVRYVETGKTPMRSRSLEASVFIDSYGTVYPSIMWDRKIGNIRNSSYDLAQILKSKEAEEAMKELKSGNTPEFWTSCEAYQSIVGNLRSFL